MVRKKTFNYGNGAVVSVLARYLKPKKAVSDAFPNYNTHKRINNCIVVRKETKEKNGKEQIFFVVVNDGVMNGDNHVELTAFARFFEGVTEGPAIDFFDRVEPREEVENADETVPFSEAVIEAMQIFGSRRANDDEVAEIRMEGIDVDDDNAPAPENFPEPVAANGPEVMNAANGPVVMNADWGHDGLCHRRMTGADNHPPKFPNFNRQTPDFVELFELLFPKQYLEEVLLLNINKNIGTESLVTYGELLAWFGCWFLISTITGPQRADFWSSENVSLFKGAPFRLNEIMSRNRFDKILKSLEYTTHAPPPYLDRFHQVRQLMEAWNANMAEAFVPSWISCLDESISPWHNPFTCPGFIFVPRKPHPFGNEYHSICCGASGIMFGVELVEGKDSPPQKPRPEFDGMGTTIGLLLRLTRNLWNSGKVVVLDSGFCVLQGIIELRRKGVFAASVIKKRRYWPKHIKGEDIKQHFEGEQLGYSDAIAGKYDNTPFHIVAMKDQAFTMMFMTTYGTLEKTGKLSGRKVGDVVVRFQYPEVLTNHFKYRHAVDDHNKLRHQPISLEDVWATKQWTHRVFAFFLAITEVNIALTLKYFFKVNIGNMVEFRKLFARALINNKYLFTTTQSPTSLRRSTRRSRENDHDHLTLPQYFKFLNGIITKSKSKYCQNQCSTCKERRVRTYCRCSPGVYRCKYCWAKHKAAEDI